MNRDAAGESISSQKIEEGEDVLLDFKKLLLIAKKGEPVIPAVVQDALSGDVLLVGYVNEKALMHALRERVATFWSTSRNELWVKGATSGDTLELLDVFVNCEQNSVLYKVKMVGKGSCHTKKADGTTRFGCYYRRVKDGKLVFVDKEK